MEQYVSQETAVIQWLTPSAKQECQHNRLYLTQEKLDSRHFQISCWRCLDDCESLKPWKLKIWIT